MGVSIMHMPVYTAIVASIMMIMQIVLMGMVIAQRAKNEVDIGDGGNDTMQKAIRVHANLVENSPIFLIGLALVELIVGSTLAVGILGAIFVVARILHAIGLNMSTGVTMGRFVGTIGTMSATTGVGAYLLYLGLSEL